MLILDVGKIKYNKKFYKAIIYATLVMDIISFGIFPKSQSKYKEDNLAKYSYSAKLYTDKLPEVEILEKIPIDIQLVEEDSKYISDSQNAFFEYQISSDSTNAKFLNYTNINKNISFQYTTKLDSDIKGECSVVQYQTSKNEKGIVWCNTNSSSFSNAGTNVTATSSDYYENKTATQIEKITFDIEGLVGYTSTQYKKLLNNLKDPKTIILNSKSDCTTFDTLLKEYADYYAENASESYNGVTGSTTTSLDFNEIDVIRSYIAKYVNSSSCNLENLDIPGIRYEEVDFESISLKRYVYTIEDNFIGYAKTYIEDKNSKQMYFTTSEGTSFLEESDKTKWESIFDEYLKYFYSKEDRESIQEYIRENTTNGILEILQQKDASTIEGITHDFKNGSISISSTLLDSIYNSKNKASGSLRVTISGSSKEMYESFKNNLSVVFGDAYDANTLELLWYNNENNPNYAERNKIHEAIISSDLTNDGIYIDGLRDYQGNSTYINTYDYTVHIYSDGTYNYFEILPLGQHYTDGSGDVLYEFGKKALSSGQNKADEYLRRIQMLDAYYGITNKHTEINASTTYRYDEEHNLIGYIRIICQFVDGNINNVRYYVHNGDFDQEKYPETHPASISATNLESSINDVPIDEENIIQTEESPTIDAMGVIDETDSVSANSNLSGEDKEGKKDSELTEPDDAIDNAIEKEVENEKTPEVPLDDDSDASSVEATPSVSSNVQEIGSNSSPSTNAETNNSMESINGIQTEIPPIPIE